MEFINLCSPTPLTPSCLFVNSKKYSVCHFSVLGIPQFIISFVLQVDLQIQCHHEKTGSKELSDTPGTWAVPSSGHSVCLEHSPFLWVPAAPGTSLSYSHQGCL